MSAPSPFFATCAKGLEPLLEAELRDELGLGRGLKSRVAGVAFEGTLADALRVCLWTRFASRVLLPLKTFPAPDPEKLYGGVKAIRWSDHVTPAQTIAVDFSSKNSAITHTQFGAQKTKDAVCDQLVSVQGARPSVDLQDPDVRINVYVRDDQATVSLDLAGASLHERGYRTEAGAAPLKENLAAAVLALSGWDDLLKTALAAAPGPMPTLEDPMCGSGTLLIEGARRALDVAPGLGREKWGFTRWRGFDDSARRAWNRLRDEARERNRARGARLAAAPGGTRPFARGFDADARVLVAARANAERAGLAPWIHFERRDLAQAAAAGPSGLLVANPPYDERLEADASLYDQLGDRMKKGYPGWRAGVLTASPVFAKAIGLKPDRKHVLFNGALECRLLTYTLYAGTRR